MVLTGILAGLSGMVCTNFTRDSAPAFGLQLWANRRFGVILGVTSHPATPHRGNRGRRRRRRFGWWLLGRYGQRRVSIAAAVANPGLPMPAGTTIHALLQIVTVALGSRLAAKWRPGKSRARAGGGMVARKLRLLEDETRTLIACGAGAVWRRSITSRWPGVVQPGHAAVVCGKGASGDNDLGDCRTDGHPGVRG